MDIEKKFNGNECIWHISISDEKEKVQKSGVGILDLTETIEGITDYKVWKETKYSADFPRKEGLINLWIDTARSANQNNIFINACVARIKSEKMSLLGHDVILRDCSIDIEEEKIIPLHKGNFWLGRWMVSRYPGQIVFRLTTHDIISGKPVKDVRNIDLHPIIDKDLIQKIMIGSQIIYMPITVTAGGNKAIIYGNA